MPVPLYDAEPAALSVMRIETAKPPVWRPDVDVTLVNERRVHRVESDDADGRGPDREVTERQAQARINRNPTGHRSVLPDGRAQLPLHRSPRTRSPPFSGPPTSESHRRTTSIRPLFFVNVGDSDARCGLFNLCIEFFIDACDVGSEHEAHRFHLGNEHRVRLLKRGDRLAHGDEIVLLLV